MKYEVIRKQRIKQKTIKSRKANRAAVQIESQQKLKISHKKILFKRTAVTEYI